MRGLWLAGTLGALIATADQGLPPDAQTMLESAVLKGSEGLEGRIKATVLGTLGSDADLAFGRWDVAVRLWKQEKGSGAAPFLAEGVLFDCLGRLQGVSHHALSTEKPQPFFYDLAAARPARAAKAFDAALKLNPTLEEARFRAARIRAPADAAAGRDLEKIADRAKSPLNYLAAVSRAEVARARSDAAGAIQWYERALELQPRSTAAAIGLRGLQPGTRRSLDDRDADDVYYTYPCTILTADVDAALAGRLRNVVLK